MQFGVAVSFLYIDDREGNKQIIALKRLEKVTVEWVQPEDVDIGGITVIKLTPIDKDHSAELIESTTPVEEIWDQIKMRM